MAPPVVKEHGVGHFTGPHESLVKMKDVRDTLARLDRVGIDLLSFGIVITAVYSRARSARPYGFDFKCKRAKDLLGKVISLSNRKLAMRFDDYSKSDSPKFNEDTKQTTEGKFSALVTHGRGFREIGIGSALHIEIDAANETCNVHVDSNSYVAGPQTYDWGHTALKHGYWDLASHYAPGMFGRLGERGRIGPMVRPITDPQGKRRWIVGFLGEW